jgi:hypothetical protein
MKDGKHRAPNSHTDCRARILSKEKEYTPNKHNVGYTKGSHGYHPTFFVSETESEKGGEKTKNVQESKNGTHAFSRIVSHGVYRDG